MDKKKILITGILLVASAFASNALAAGQGGGSGGVSSASAPAPSPTPNGQIQQHIQVLDQGEDSQIQLQDAERTRARVDIPLDGNMGTQTQRRIQDEGVGVENQVKNRNQVKDNGEEGRVESRVREQSSVEEHHSTVADSLQKLLEIGDKGVVGQQVKVIAQQQNQSEETTVQAMEKVQTRSSIKTFFIGTDYKNLGTLRSETVQTRNRLEQLNRLAESVQSEGERAEIQSQIQTLEQEQVRVENFIKAQEEKFSLFGWVAKWLAK